MTTSPLPQFVTYRAAVTKVQKLGPHFVRVTFGGAGLSEFECAGVAPKIKVWIPAATDPIPETGPFDEALAAALVRTYTVRAHRPDANEVDIDFVIHEEGPAGRWAGSARPGQLIILSNAAGHAALSSHRTLFVGDPSSLPAIMTVLEAQQAGAAARVLLITDHDDDRFTLDPGAAEITRWLTTSGDPLALERGVREELDAFAPDYVWCAGEANALKPLRRFLRGEAGFDKLSSHVVGYWRRGANADVYDAETIARAFALVGAGVELTYQELDELSLGDHDLDRATPKRAA